MDPQKLLFDQVVRFQRPKDDKLYAHQRFMVDYLKSHPGKNLGVFFEAGTGKTLPAVMHALHTPCKRVVYMGPASLHAVFRHHLQQIGGNPAKLDEKGHPFFATVTSNASNVFEQWRRAVEPVLGKIAHFKEKESRGTHERLETGEPAYSAAPDVICILDEAHLFSTRVAGILVQIYYASSDEMKDYSAEKQAHQLYRHLCRDTRVQLIALSGTPVHNHPFNSVPLFNMLRKEFTGVDGRRALAFSEKYSQFYDNFVRGVTAKLPLELETEEAKVGGGKEAKVGGGKEAKVGGGKEAKVGGGKEAKGKTEEEKPIYLETVAWVPPDQERSRDVKQKMDVFAMRIRDLGIWFESPKGMEGSMIPSIEEDVVVRVPMGDFQWSIYQQRETEEQDIEDRMRKYEDERGENEPIVDSKSVFQSLTQQASNYAYPKPFYTLYKGEGAKMLEAMGDEGFTLKGLEKHACKMAAILRRVFSERDRIHAVYSHYVKGAGIQSMVRALKLMGWRSVNEAIAAGRKDFDAIKKDALTLSKASADGPPAYFAVLTGDEAERMREEVMRVFNNKENASMRVVRVIFYSGAASHGLTFKSVERVHFLESLWDSVEYTQAIDRTVRIWSAAWLPPDRQKVKVARYLAVAPYRGLVTSDERKLALVERKLVVESYFIDAIKANCVNCHLQFSAENARDAELISAGKVPPSRTFFRCERCTASYEPSFTIQEVKETGCSIEEKKLTDVKRAVKMVEGKGKSSRTFTLDPSTGLVWDGPNLVVDSTISRGLWKKYLGR